MRVLDLGRVVGMSAYELAVSKGYDGTLESWLESLRYDHSDEYKQFTETIDAAKQDILSGKEEINSGKEEIKLSMTQIRDLVEESLTDIGNAKKAATEAVKAEETESVSNIASAKSGALSNIGDAETNALTSLANTLDSAIRSINEKGTRWEKQIEDTGALAKSEYNQNAIAKQKAFDDNAEKKQSAFDTHVAETQTTLDQHISEKQTAFDQNAEAKQTAYDQNSEQKIQEYDTHTEQIQADIGQLKEDKLTKPADPPIIGKILKVKSVNEDGTFVCEWADGGNNLDVQIDGQSIVQDSVANIPIGSQGKPGVLGIPGKSYGLYKDETNNIRLIGLTNEEIDKRSYLKPLMGNSFDYAVKAAMCDGKGVTWTADEQAAARERIGIGKWELIADVTLEEDVNSYKVQTQYGYKHIRVFLDNVADNTNGSFYSYGIIKRTNDVYQEAVCISFNDLSTRYKYGSIDMECINGNVILITECSVKASKDSEVGIYNYSAFKQSWYYADKLFGINFKTIEETNQLKKGTKIQVYGVKA